MVAIQRPMRKQQAGILGGLLLVILVTGCSTSSSFNGAPLYQREVDTPLIYRRGLGPIYENSDRFDSQHLFAIRPLYSHYIDDQKQQTSRDVLWPFYIYRDQPEMTTHLVLAGLFRRRSYDNGAAGMWLLPIWFQGHTQGGKESYFAIFPLGGNIKDFVGYDNIWFWLFPLYLSTQKSETESQTLFWPILSKTDGPKVTKRRVFPFYGFAEHTEGWKNHFILWPIIHFGHPVKEHQVGSAFFILPLGGYINFKNEETGAFLKNRTALWPFFSYMWNQNGSRTHCPWPFVQVYRNYPDKGDSRTWIWPLWGKGHEADRDNWFVLWPFIQHQKEASTSKGAATQFYVLPFWWDFSYKKENAPELRYRRLWPLASLDQQGEDYTRFRTLDLWPVRQHTVIDRNFAPLWTLYEYQRQGNRRQHDLLWGVWQYQKAEHVERCSLFPLFSYRHSANDEKRSLNLLTGIFGRERVGDETKTRLLWFLKF